MIFYASAGIKTDEMCSGCIRHSDGPLSTLPAAGRYVAAAWEGYPNAENNKNDNWLVGPVFYVGTAPSYQLTTRLNCNQEFLLTGETAKVEVSVTNNGIPPSVDPVIQLFASFQTNGTGLTATGTINRCGLEMFETQVKTLTFTAPDTPGTYRYEVCVDAVCSGVINFEVK